MYDMMSSFASAETQTNNLKDFKTYLEGDDELSSHISSISYDYDLGMSIYAKDTDDKVFKSDVTELLQTCMSELLRRRLQQLFRALRLGLLRDGDLGADAPAAG